MCFHWDYMKFVQMMRETTSSGRHFIHAPAIEIYSGVIIARQLCCEQLLFSAASVRASVHLSAENLENYLSKIDVTW